MAHKTTTLLLTALATTAVGLGANATTKAETDFARIERLTADSAITVLKQKLDSAQATGRKGYESYLKEAESALASPESPVHSEQMWIEVLRHQCASPLIKGADKARPEYLLNDAKKNMIGTQATDIDLMLKDGSTTTLSKIASGDNRLTLLYFTNPDCEACQLAKGRIAESPVISRMVAEGTLKVVAVYPLDDEQLWSRTQMPPTVIDTWNSTQSIEADETYVLPSMPLFYLLDSKMTVIMKNEASLKRMEQALLKAANAGNCSTE